MTFFEFLYERHQQIIELLLEHTKITLEALLIAIIIGILIGILISMNKYLSKIVMTIINALQAIPSLALLGFLIPFIGVNEKTAIILVVIYAILPIVKNTFVGLYNISPNYIEVSKGLGMTKLQALFHVQLPIALPVIMAGIRISAVNSVGLVTIASYAGGKGLGFLVYSGINTVDMNMILAGAIPAAILALIMDFVVGKIEHFIVPIGIQKDKKISMTKSTYFKQKRKRKMVLILTSICIVLGVMIDSYMQISKNNNQTVIITVGSKAYTEQQILGNILSEVIASNPNFKVEKKIGLGGTSICYEALEKGSIDLYVEYSAGLYLNQLKKEFKPIKKDEIYDSIKPLLEKQGIIADTRLGFSNDYELTVTKEFAMQNNLKSIADLEPFKDEIVVAPTFEYVNRADGMLGINSLYGFNFKNISPMEAGLRYTALNSGEVQVINTFSTDGMKYKLDLVALEDPKNVHMSQEAIVIFNKNTYEKNPDLVKTLSILEGKISEEDMMEMNYKVDVEGKTPEEVSHQFLINEGILK